MLHKRYKLASIIALTVMLQACGGGGGDKAGPAVNPGAPTLTSPPASTSSVVGESVELSVTASGDGPLTYQWQHNGVDIPGATEATLKVSGLTLGHDGTAYTVKVSNAAGAVISNAAILNVFKERKDHYLAPPPPVTLSVVYPASGDTVTIKAAIDGAQAITLTPEGEGCGALKPVSIVGSKVETTGAAGHVGSCFITAEAVTARGTQRYTNEFTVTPRSLTGQGLSFTDGTYFPSGTYTKSVSSYASISAISIPQALVNGGGGVIYIDTPAPSEGQKALFRVEGVPGYYVVPGQLDNGRLRYDVTLSQDFLKDSPAASTRAVSASLIDGHGALSAPASTAATMTTVASGPLQVSLSFNKGDDLDLHVVTPAGPEIYWEAKTELTGGKLDLDSNASCSVLSGVNSENIAWPIGTKPGAGTYKVRVDFYQSCSSTPVNYTVKVVNCGAVTSFSGSFQPSDADKGQAGSGREVATFSYTPCSGFSVAGRATYDDYVPSTGGLGTTANALPIRLAKVEVRSVTGDTLLATTATDDSGNYKATFNMATPGKYVVRVVAEQNNATVKQTVANSAGAVYAVRSAEIDAATAMTVTGADVHATVGNGAEAFNIFDIGLRSFREVTARVSGTLPMLKWEWTKGTATCSGNASCYSNSQTKIWVLSSASDEDAYDDAVLGHEFGHFFMQKLSKENSPGGPHTADNRSNPLLAWSEGAATFFGNQVIGSPQYIDTRSGSASGFDLETMPASLQPGGANAGTAGNTLNGDIAELVVAGIMWDLGDAPQDTATTTATPPVTIKDTINMTTRVYTTLMKMKGGTDRGKPGPDVLDFIDTFLCPASASPAWEASAGDNFNGLISVMHSFPYTLTGKPACKP